MRISIVTPVMDRAEYLDETIESVITQAGDFALQYIIQNGGRSAEIKDILEKWQYKIKTGYNSRCRELQFTVVSEHDTGMYDALNRGFARASGNILAWINSDDLYHPNALHTVSRACNNNPSIHWLIGIANSLNHEGSRTGFDLFPRAYSKEFARRGYYREENVPYGLTWIPQDCTFWTSELWNVTGARLRSDLKYASDFFLWRTFAEKSQPVKLATFLGSYRVHDNQITANPESYKSELPLHVGLPFGWRLLYNSMRQAPGLEKAIFNKYCGAPFVQALGLQWDWLVGQTVYWSFASKRWEMTLLPIA